MFAMNSSRPLFRNNPRLRKAVNFALDRQAIQDIGGGPLSGVTTDQYLPSAVPGFSDAHVYPLDDPDLEKAKALASGNLRGGKAVLYTTDFPLPLAAARLAKQQLAAIGLEVDIKAFPIHIATAAYVKRLAAPGSMGSRARPVDAEPSGPVRVHQHTARGPVRPGARMSPASRPPTTTARCATPRVSPCADAESSLQGARRQAGP